MAATTIATVAAAAIGAGASIYSASKSGKAQKEAGQMGYDASTYAANLQHEEWLQTQANMQPWLTAGTGAVNQLSGLMQPGGKLYQTTPALDQLQMDPSYNWRMQQGVNALSASGAASGMYGSGNMGTALVDYGQNLASTEYQNAYNRWQNEQTNLYNRLAGISGTGQTTAQQLGQLGANAATSMGNYGITGANYLGAGNVGAANAFAGGITGAENQLMSGLGAYQNYVQNQNWINAYNQRTNAQGGFNAMNYYGVGGGGGYDYGSADYYSPFYGGGG